ncbi:hypothetical protein CPC08DRAFT_822130 [Agrocybe pediades]|nr:hypothetical protein CPC08DRAFT_822130 [Agrocybe pediades]
MPRKSSISPSKCMKVARPAPKKQTSEKRSKSFGKQMQAALEARGANDWDFTSLSPKIEAYIRQQMVKRKHPMPSYWSPLDLRSLPQFNPIKPDYFTLILLAIWGSPEKRLTLQGIYAAINHRFGIRMTKANEGSLRHKLSHEKELFYNLKPLTGWFPTSSRRKRRKDDGQLGNGEPWMINPFFIYSLDPKPLEKFYAPPPLLCNIPVSLYLDNFTPFDASEACVDCALGPFPSLHLCSHSPGTPLPPLYNSYFEPRSHFHL